MPVVSPRVANTLCLYVRAGVALGAVLGHGLATLLAVTAGALASQYVSEKTLGFIGGTLFLVFAVATLFSAF